MDVEAALAAAEADLGVIPRDAAEKIIKCARLELLDSKRIKEAMKTTEHSLMPLINELARVCGEEPGGYVHWGATTQNVTQTGFILMVRRGQRILFDLFATLLAHLGDLAMKTKNYILPARTHGQHALPATFGFKVALWIDELCRHVERLGQCHPRLFVAMLGGGAGTYASFGNKGPVIQARMGHHLGLGSMTIPGRTIVDHLTEYVLILVMLGTTCGKIAREMRELMKVEFGEVEEPIPDGSLGSSTMPQKRNPKLCMEVIVLETELRSLMALSVEAMLSDHEADGARTAMEGTAVVKAMTLVGDILATMTVLMSGLRVFPERMKKNLEMTHGMIVTEHLMLVLGNYIGRQEAHHIVHEACEKVAHDPDHVQLIDTLMEDELVSSHLTREVVMDALQPIKYTGMCAELAQQNAYRARDVANVLRRFIGQKRNVVGGQQKGPKEIFQELESPPPLPSYARKHFGPVNQGNRPVNKQEQQRISSNQKQGSSSKESNNGNEMDGSTSSTSTTETNETESIDVKPSEVLVENNATTKTDVNSDATNTLTAGFQDLNVSSSPLKKDL